MLSAKISDIRFHKSGRGEEPYKVAGTKPPNSQTNNCTTNKKPSNHQTNDQTNQPLNPLNSFNPSNQLNPKEHQWQRWFWLIILLEAPAIALLNADGVGEAFVFRIFGMITKLAAAYSLTFVLIPRFWFRKRYLWFAFWLVIWAIAFSFLARIINVHLAERLLGVGAPYESLWEIIQQFSQTVDAYFNRFFGTAFWFAFIKIGIDQLRSQQQLLQLKREKAEAELNFLKAQMHPHFLFNTLNNLYTLTLEKSDQAPQVVIKLSEMLDYLLYQCSAPRVPIAKEIELIENYLGLEALRYGERLQLDFEHTVEDAATLVAPLLLLSLVENAFKHGVGGAVGQHTIKIDLTIQDRRLQFQVQNTKPSPPAAAESTISGGIGLTNIRSQLALTYPDHHTLSTHEEANWYTAKLVVSLDKSLSR